jgi:PhzF family phenazine biosynthesis protein
MHYEFYQVDAFTDKVFGGNPACVVPLTQWLPDGTLLNIAKENAVAETAFFIVGENEIALRWFTPEFEMDLCGHATLATAHVLKTGLGFFDSRMVFNTNSGLLVVTVAEGLYTLDFPARKPVHCELPDAIKRSLGKQPIETLKARDYLLVYACEEDIRNIYINRQLLDEINIDPGGIIVTAKGNNCDFVSRFFTPQASIFEDPVTGSAHCSLIPYWAEKLHKTEMAAMQLSARLGKLFCVYNSERVLIKGYAKTFSKGVFWIE